MTIEHAQILEILSAGIQAPSADNSQPWKFRVVPGAIHVFYDVSRLGMFFDYALSATYMSLGAVCENMVLHAGKLGLDAEVDLCVDQPLEVGHVFSLRFSQRNVAYDPLADAIPERATNRFLYRRRCDVAGSVLADIAHAISPGQGCRVVWAHDPVARRQLGRAVFQSDLVRFTHPLIHRGFHDTLRFGRDVEISNDGLAAETLGIERPMLPLLRMLRPWGLAHLLNRVGLHYFMAWRGGLLPMWASSQHGTIIASSQVDYFDMGRAFERVWLAATRAGLAFQPLGALPLLLFRWQDRADTGLPEKHKARLRQADAAWRAGTDAAASDRLVMVFRVGRALGAAPRSRRRPVDQFLMDQIRSP